MNYIRQKVGGMIKAIGTFLNTEHPGLTNVSDIFTVGISVISIVIAFMSYDYVKNHDQQIAKIEQANEISSWVVHDSKGGVQMVENSPLMKVSVNNGSDQPIYLSGTNNTVCVGTVPPGRFTTYVPYPGEGMHVRVESVIAFRDNKGNNWIRNAKGVLSEIKMNSYEYLKLDLPPDNWQSLESE